MYPEGAEVLGYIASRGLSDFSGSCVDTTFMDLRVMMSCDNSEESLQACKSGLASAGDLLLPTALTVTLPSLKS